MGNRHMLQAEMKVTAIKAAGGVVAGGGGYVVGIEKAQHWAITIEQAQAYGALTATLCMALYFFLQAAYTVWKWNRERKGKQ